MRTTRWMAAAAAVMALGLALSGTALLCGCEDTDGDDRGDLPSAGTFVITPVNYIYGATSMNVVAFSVKGGEAPFKWSLSDSTMGSVTVTDERTVNYRPTKAEPGAVNLLRVTDRRGWSTLSTIKRKN